MGQEIKIRIAGKEYEMTAPTPELEGLIRKAADRVTDDVNAYVRKFPGKEMTDILSFVALNEALGKLSLEKKLSGLEAEADTLAKETESYIVNTGN